LPIPFSSFREKRGKCLCSMVITGMVMTIGDSYIHTFQKHRDQFSDLCKSGFTVGEYVTVSTDSRLAVATGTVCDITQSTVTLSLKRSVHIQVSLYLQQIVCSSYACVARETEKSACEKGPYQAKPNGSSCDQL